MDLFAQIDFLVNRSRVVITQKARKQKIELYSEGLKAKTNQAKFALENLDSFSNQSDHIVSSTARDEFTISEKVGFFCDAYWTFLYSSLDVLAQIINQALKLDLKENVVSFNSVAKHLEQKQENSNIQQKFKDCRNSYVFKHLDAYRNCSTHRRQIYIKEEVKIVKHTPGYRTTSIGSVEGVERIICDNPLELTPLVKQQRRIPVFMEDTSNKILNHIIKILKNTEPIK